MKRIFLAEKKQSLHDCYSPEQIGEASVLDMDTFWKAPEAYRDTLHMFSTWGPPKLSTEQLAQYLPNLQTLFYGAGTIHFFCEPYFSRGVRIFTGRQGNAVPVAEFTVAQILLANKGYFQLHGRYRSGGHGEVQAYADGFAGNYDTSVGLLGAGAICRYTIELLRPYNLHLMVYDPYLSAEEAVSLGVEKAGLEDIFARCQTISNHLPNLPETKGILNRPLFSLMRENATFINTARGAQVVMGDLIWAMEQAPQRTALLDVTDPAEPLPLDHPVWDVPNIFCTPHRAGALNAEIRRIGKIMFEEYQRLLAGEPTLHEVTPEMLKTMA